ncbi:MAG: copper-binding protein [Moraxellaceae bacterium]|nr:copper-binding protein [Moraxellaceae bacterium]
MIKTLLSLVTMAWLACTSLYALAQTSASTGTELPLADATVRKVDKAAGRLTLSHGELVNLDMPPMTMAFRVKDPGWLDKVKVGDKLRVAVDKVDGSYTVVRVEPAP